MKKTYIFILITTIFLNACTISYDNFYKLDNQYLERRQLETRFFETNNEAKILDASVQVLQDLGYIISESNTKLGIITGSKDREAGSTGQKVGAIFVAALFGGTSVYDVSQKIFVTLVSNKSNIKNGYNIRVEFATGIYNNVGSYRVERRLEPEIYKEFFDKLSQSVFLTANDL